MANSTEEIISRLITSVSAMEGVRSIGITGGDAPFPKAGEGDIDIFIYCGAIPASGGRLAALEQLSSFLGDIKADVFDSAIWGVGDFALINGVETWLMYFNANDALANLESILNGDYPERLDNYYYPVGRCAMLKNIRIMYDKDGFLREIKDRLSEYPGELAEKLAAYHLDALDDVEDLERAVHRKDALFYHFALDLAIDHFLQALFAINKVYFPSRKRTFQYINSFQIKPAGCGERLSDVVRLGGDLESIAQSYDLWRGLVDDLKSLRR